MPIYKKNKGLRLTRYGALNLVKQDNQSAPARYGLWAFIWPYFDWWFVSGAMSKSKFDKDGGIISANYRNFFASGVIYTRIQVPKSEKIGSWYKTTTRDLYDYLPKVFANDLKFSRNFQVTDRDRDPLGFNKPFCISYDHYEVFVPRGAKIG